MEAPVGPPALVEPDPGQTLSDGLIIESSLLARLLGLKLLTLEGTIVLSPAHVRVSQPPVAVVSPAVRDGIPPHRAENANTPPTAPSSSIGSGLAQAVRLLDESAAELGETGAGRRSSGLRSR